MWGATNQAAGRVVAPVGMDLAEVVPAVVAMDPAGVEEAAIHPAVADRVAEATDPAVADRAAAQEPSRPVNRTADPAAQAGAQATVAASIFRLDRTPTARRRSSPSLTRD